MSENVGKFDSLFVIMIKSADGSHMLDKTTFIQLNPSVYCLFFSTTLLTEGMTDSRMHSALYQPLLIPCLSEDNPP